MSVTSSRQSSCVTCGGRCAGFLVELISPSVTSGFTSATALIIVVAQLKGLLGLSFVAESPVENLYLIAQRWRDVRAPDAALAAVCCALLLLLRVTHLFTASLLESTC